MPVELRHLRAFHVVATELNFRRAAERLNIAQPALTRIIKDLEHMLSVTLLERTTRVVDLTEAGHWLLKETKAPLDHLDQAMHRARRIQIGAAGELRVGFTDFAINGLLPEIIREFRSTAPEVDVILKDSNSMAMIDQVLEGDLDIAFVTDPYKHKHLDSIVTRKERLVAVLPETHRLASKEIISVTDLASEPFVLGRIETWRSFHRLLREFCLPHGFDLMVVQHAVHSDGIMALVAAEVGVTLYVDAEWLHGRPGIIVKKIREPTPTITTQAIWRRDRYTINGKIIEFIKSINFIINKCGLYY